MPPKFNKNRKPLLTGGKPAKTSRSAQRTGRRGPVSQQQKRRRELPSGAFSCCWRWLQSRSRSESRERRIRPAARSCWTEPHPRSRIPQDNARGSPDGSTRRRESPSTQTNPGRSWAPPAEPARHISPAPTEFRLHADLHRRLIGLEGGVRCKHCDQPIEISALRAAMRKASIIA